MELSADLHELRSGAIPSIDDLGAHASLELFDGAIDLGVGTGGPLTGANIQQRLTMRNFMDDLRATGVKTGGPPPMDAKDRQKFASHLDKILTRELRKQSR